MRHPTFGFGMLVLVSGLLGAGAAGCSSIRPYRVGGPALEELPLRAPVRASRLPRLPDGRPLVIGIFDWHVASPVGLKINMEGRRLPVSPVAATYYGRAVHLALFEGFFDAVARRRRAVYRDYLGFSHPGTLPSWARRQRFLVLKAEILAFEHSKIRPAGGVTPRGREQPDPRWGHEAAYVKVHYWIRDAVTMKVLLSRVVSVHHKVVHTHRALDFKPYRALGLQLLKRMRADRRFVQILGAR